MRNLAIIPARGGSKRIPKKNIVDFLGQPIISYPITVAIKSGLFSRVMVSTDDEEIKKIALSFGAEVPFKRSRICSNDTATIPEVMDEVLLKYNQLGESFDYVCCIFPTSVLIKVNHLEKGLDTLINSNFDSIRPIVKFSYPIQRALTLEDGKIDLMFPEHIKTRTQDLQNSFHDSGLYYWMRSDKLLSGWNKGAIEISEMEVQDIDNPIDIKLAELKYKLQNI